MSMHSSPMRRPSLFAVVVVVVAACGDLNPGPGTSETTGDPPGTSTGDPPGTSTGGATEVDTSSTSATSAPAGCPDTDPRVGWRATFATHHHGVAGTAEIRDDCTIVVSDFTYDGTGLDVRFYGGKDGDYAGGFALSDDLLRPGGYSGETLVLTLPEDRTLGDLDGLSVWCVDVGIDFGSGLFAAP